MPPRKRKGRAEKVRRGPCRPGSHAAAWRHTRQTGSRKEWARGAAEPRKIYNHKEHKEHEEAPRKIGRETRISFLRALCGAIFPSAAPRLRVDHCTGDQGGFRSDGIIRCHSRGSGKPAGDTRRPPLMRSASLPLHRSCAIVPGRDEFSAPGTICCRPYLLPNALMPSGVPLPVGPS